MKILNKKSRKQKRSPELSISIGILAFIALFGLMSILSSCKSKEVLTKSSDVVNESFVGVFEKDKLTPVAVQGENASLTALFECDSTNKVLLKQFGELKSKNMNSSFSFTNGQLNYKAQTEPDTVFVKSTDQRYYVNRQITKTITITKKLTKQVDKFGFLDWVGLISILSIFGFLGFKLSNIKFF